MKANAERWDTTAQARALSDRPILLVSAMFKADQDSLVTALNRVGARRVTALAWDTDHSFSDRRIALARAVTGVASILVRAVATARALARRSVF